MPRASSKIFLSIRYSPFVIFTSNCYKYLTYINHSGVRFFFFMEFNVETGPHGSLNF